MRHSGHLARPRAGDPATAATSAQRWKSRPTQHGEITSGGRSATTPACQLRPSSSQASRTQF
eukprot:6633905-Alexandrium_andersonii.AAC.1